MNKKNRREFLSKVLAIGASTTFPFLNYAKTSPPPIPSLKGRKILFTYGGWDGHEPIRYVDFLVPWMKQEGALVTLADTLDVYTDKTLMDNTDLIVQIFTMSQITREQETGLLEAIEKNGTGMAGWHGGICDAFRNNPAYQYMTGGQWVAHPGGVIDYSVQIIDRNDSITTGLEDFSMHTEQYYMHVDPNVKVLATTTFKGTHNYWIDGCVMPVVWKKMHGKGRIFFSSLGHNLHHITERPEAVAILKRGIQWAASSKYEPPEKWMTPVYANRI